MANKEEKAARHEKVESFKKELRTAAGINMKLAEITEKPAIGRLTSRL